MTRAPGILRSAIAVSILSVSSLGIVGFGQPRIATDLGIDGIVVPGRYAPLSIAVSDYHELSPSSVRVLQSVGNDWRGTAAITQDLGLVIQGDGDYETTIPVYDPLNPIAIQLLSDDGSVLAQTELDTREGMRALPYPLLCRTLPYFPIDAEVTDMAALPEQWLAYDGLASLWISAPPSPASWEAIAQWVVAGGSVVVFAGADYYRLDSPAVRQLLPIADPSLDRRADDVPYLDGVLRPNAQVLQSAAEVPLLITWNFGAGSVSLVTVRAQTLTEDELLGIASDIPDATMISLSDATDSSLMQMSTSGPRNTSVLLLIGSLILVAGGTSLVGRKAPRAAWAAFAGALGLIIVLSGFMSNSANQTVPIYTFNTHLSVETPFGIDMVFTSIYAADAGTAQWTGDAESVPVEDLPRSLYEGGSYDSQWQVGTASLELDGDEVRRFHAYATAAPAFSVRAAGDRIVIANYALESFVDAWIVRGGQVYALDVLRSGTHEYLLGDPEEGVGSFLLGAQEQTRMMRDVGAHFPLRQGVWLLAYAPGEERLDQVSGHGQKVRDATVIVVQGEDAS